MKFPDRLPDWSRWALVLPAAVGAWVGAQIFITVIANFFYPMGYWNFATWLVKTATIVAAPYCFVWAGAKTAPRRSFAVAVALAVVHAIAATTVLLLAVKAEGGGAPIWWVITGYMVGISATIAACVRLRRGGKPKTIDIPLPS